MKDEKFKRNMHMFRRLWFALGTLLRLSVVYALLSSVQGLAAVTITVTTTADSGPGSLRQALLEAMDGDTIQFDPSLNDLTITLTSGELVVDKSVTIIGPGPAALKVERAFDAPKFSIIHVRPSVTVTVYGLTISQGVPSGGGFFNENGALTIDNCVVSQNFGLGGVLGGGIGNFGDSTVLTILNSAITDNFSDFGGGIYNGVGSVTIVDSIISGNFAPGTKIGSGGGIANSGPLEIRNSTVDSNSAGVSGGGISSGGAISTLTLIDSTVSGNHAGTNQNGTGIGGGIAIDGALTIESSTISGNTASSTKVSGDGGGIATNGPSAIVAINNSTISGNFAKAGAGGVSSNGQLTINSSTISGNWSNGSTGGVGSGPNGTLQIRHCVLDAGPSGANLSGSPGTVISLGYNMSNDDGGGFLNGTGDRINTPVMLGPLWDNGGPTFTHELLADSPAINAGDPSFTPPPLYDQRGPGYDRIRGGRIDIGSVELNPSPSSTPLPSPTGTPITTPTPSATPAPFTKVLNLSTRLQVGAGDTVMIGGFIVIGSTPKKVVVRGIGPSLAALGLSGLLPDPILELRGSEGNLLLRNDDWEDDTSQASELTALGLALQNPKESGMVMTLPLGTYTALLGGNDQSEGLGLVEIYDADPTAASRLGNISTRGFVEAGDNVMIGGFIFGKGSARVAVRGIGPSLSAFGLNNALADPTLELHDSNGTLVIANDNWQDDQASAKQLIANGLAPSDSLESGIFIQLQSGAFTAILAGKSSGTGVGLLEIYDLQAEADANR